MVHPSVRRRMAALHAERNALVEEQVATPAKTHTEESLMKLTKQALEDLGRSEFNIELDKRKTKAKLVAELLNAQG